MHKCYNGSKLGDLLVAAGVIAERSVDNALKGKHYKRGPHCPQLIYEALVCQVMLDQIVPHLNDETKDNLTILWDTTMPQ